MTDRAPAAGRMKLVVLALLYFAQGLPFGFQSKGLKLALTALGLSMTKVTLTSLLSAPWWLKPIWGPFVDQYGSARFGRRKSWIIPMQILLALSFVGAAWSPPDTSLSTLLFFVFLMNLFASIQDVPVDGLAIDLLSERELGTGNAIQVVGYKVGMLVGGSVLVSQLPKLGWAGMMLSMAGITLMVAALVTTVREPARTLGPEVTEEKLSWREIGSRLKQAVRVPGGVLLLIFVATYKSGESLADSVFEPYLNRVRGLPVDVVAQYAGWGMGGSLLGSVIGGLIAVRFSLLRAVGVSALLRAIPLVGMWLLVLDVFAPTAATIISLTTIEHFFGGMLTTAMFAFMMSRVDRRIGATHFTFLAAVEVIGKSPWSVFSGALVDRLGWSAVFAIGVAATVGFLALVPLMARAVAPRS